MKEESKIQKKQDLIFSTRCSDVFKQEEEQNLYLIWKLKYPINEDLLSSFEQRLENIKSISNLELGRFRPSNPPSVVARYQNLSPIIGSSWIPIELEDKFISILELVKKLHEQEIVIGDMSDYSFMQNENKQIILGSILGDFDFAATQTALLPPQEILNYLAPERSSSAKSSHLTDIYGLGVYAYKLFTSYYPKNNDKASSVRSDVPIWLDPIVERCLSEDPQKRFNSIEDIIKIIKHTVNTGKLPELTRSINEDNSSVKNSDKAKKTKTQLVKPDSKKEVEKEARKLKNEIATKKEKRSFNKKNLDRNLETKNKSSFKKTFLWVFSTLMGLAVASFLFLSIGADKSKKDTQEDIESNNPLSLVAEYASTESRELISKLLKSQNIEEKKQILSAISKVDPKISLDVYSAIITGSNNSDLTLEARNLVAKNLENNEMPITAGLLEDWLAYKGAATPAVGLILRSIETTRPAQSKIDLLKKASEKDQINSLRFAAALAMDLDEDEYQVGLKEMLNQVEPGDDYDDLGLGALLLSHSAFRIFLNKDLSDTIKKFSDRDLKWSLQKSSESNAPVIKNIAQELISRNMLNPAQMVFIGILIKDNKRSAVYNKELVLATLDKLKSSDLHNLARWDSLDSEKILLTICAHSKDNKIVRESFELLAAKSFQNRIADTFVKWVKDGFWDYRSKLAKPVAVLSLSEIASPDEINQAFDRLMPFAKGGLFSVLSSTNDPYLIKNALNRMGEILPSGELVSLLSNDSAEIRIEVVKALKGRNELKVLQGIKKAYGAEKDPTVRQAYNEYHWVTKKGNKKGF